MKYFLLIILALVLVGCTRTKEPAAADRIVKATQATQSTQAARPAASEPISTESEQVPVEPELFRPLANAKDEDFVRVRDYLPSVCTELKYATADNFTGQVIYDFEDVFLRYGTVVKLMAVAAELEEQGLGIKIWDGFRPISAQFRLWEICPDDTYVANPNKGYSNHSRGFAVDLTLVDADGEELEMPTGFDDFSARADRDYSDCNPQARENALLLEAVMEKHGFQGYWGEWWHFNDTTKYEVETCFDPGVVSFRTTGVQTPLLEEFWDESTGILKIPAGETVTLLGYDEGFALVEYWGYRGYVALEDLKTE